MMARKAARVLPVPVGAANSVWSPPAMAGQAAVWIGLGASKSVRNQASTAGWNRASVMEIRFGRE